MWGYPANQNIPFSGLPNNWGFTVFPGVWNGFGPTGSTFPWVLRCWIPASSTPLSVIVDSCVLKRASFCYSSCWVSWIASLTFRPCYMFKCLWGIWFSDEVVFFFKNIVPHMTSLHFCNEFLCVWMLLKVDLHRCSFVMQRYTEMIVMGWPSY